MSSEQFVHTEDICLGTTDFKIAPEGKLAFEETGLVEIIGFVSCRGCPGKRAVSRAKVIVDRCAAQCVRLVCLPGGGAIGFPCPHFETMKETVLCKAYILSGYNPSFFIILNSVLRLICKERAACLA